MNTKKLVVDGGFPYVPGVEAEFFFRDSVRGMADDKQRIMACQLDVRLRREIMADLSACLSRCGCYNPSEREFVTRVYKQHSMFSNGYNETFSDEIMPYAREAPGRRVLEIGFGYGDYFSFFDDWDYFGLESSPYMIWKARQSEHLGQKQLRRTKDGKNFPVDSESVDFVLGNLSMHQIENWQHELDECGRVLKSEGRVYFVERTGPENPKHSNFARFDPHYNTPEQVAAYLTEKGMEVTVEEHGGTFWGEVLIPDGFFQFKHIKAVKS